MTQPPICRWCNETPTILNNPDSVRIKCNCATVIYTNNMNCQYGNYELALKNWEETRGSTCNG